MKNRLELFRSQIAAFDGAADPMNAISKGYFIEEPHQSSTNALFKRISLRPQSKILLIGGIGSGKTTQLLRLQQILQQAPDTGIYPHYIDVTEYTKPNELQVGTLDAIVALELVALLKQNGLSIDIDREISIKNFAYGHTVTENLYDPLEVFRKNQQIMQARPQQMKRIIPGILTSYPRSTGSLNKLAKVISSLVEDFKNQFHKIPYFLFDGLDRIDEAEKFTRMISSDLQSSEVGFAIVGAVSLLYNTFINSIDIIFNRIEYRSAFDVDRDEEARAFFERVLFARSGQDFFQKDALEDLISLSGGVLRDLINLAQESIQEAYLADSETIEREYVKKAVRSLGRAKMLGLDGEQSSTLKNLTHQTINVPTSPEEIYLLSGGRILEYRFPEHRFDLHPVLKQLLV
jgi:energy-coupling factor transporter ATP-binding protein EcfA2